ncbi:MAG TPA: thioesterase family protein [Candidatus Acidoferrales bacterium]|jgi:acyl-CoA thioester hydrolase|nr:thioesterase family protein [Candidatus Acidoferrales bacterium]
MAYEFTIVREVEWHHTDMAGIMHFSHFFHFMEAAEHAFFRSLGLSINTTDPEPLAWPRVHVACDFSYPLRFEDSVQVHLLVREKRQKSLVYSIVFRKLNGDLQREVARGTLAVACVKRDPATGKLTAVPIPKVIADKIDAAPAEVPGT